MLVTVVMRRRDFVSHVALLLMRLGVRAEGTRQAVSADDRGVASGPGGSPGCGRGVTPPAPCPTGTRFHLPLRGPTPTRVPSARCGTGRTRRRKQLIVIFKHKFLLFR